MARLGIITCLLFSGCSSIDIEVWNTPEVQCPDSEYDYGGSFQPRLGLCKNGVGGLISYKRDL